MHSVGNMYNFRVLGLAIRVSTDRGLKLPKTKQNNKMKNFEAEVAAKCQSSINGTSDVMPTFFINPALTQKSLHRCQFKVVACMHAYRTKAVACGSADEAFNSDNIASLQ